MSAWSSELPKEQMSHGSNLAVANYHIYSVSVSNLLTWSQSYDLGLQRHDRPVHFKNKTIFLYFVITP
jgi:hypothetical protein